MIDKLSKQIKDSFQALQLIRSRFTSQFRFSNQEIEAARMDIKSLAEIKLSERFVTYILENKERLINWSQIEDSQECSISALVLTDDDVRGVIEFIIKNTPMEVINKLKGQ